MSRVADFDRDTEGMKTLFEKTDKLCESFFETAVIGDKSETAELYKLYDMILSQRSTLSAMLCSAKEIGTHGSALIDKKPDLSEGKVRTTRTVTKNKESYTEEVSGMPNPELWFETLLARKRQEMESERK